METIGVLAVLAAFALFIVTLVRAIKLALRKEKRADKHTIILGAVAVVLFIVGGSLIPSDKEAEPIKKEGPDVEEKEEVESYDITDETDIARLVVNIIGEDTNTDEKRIEDVTYNEIDIHPYIGLNLHADENVTNKLTRSGMLKDTAEIMEALYNEGYEGKFYVDWRLPLTDKYGNTESGKVMSLNISAEDFVKINFDNFLYDNLPNIAEGYFEHPGFQE